MLRDIISINGAKAPDAMHKAGSEMKTGMAVVKNDTADSKIANVTSTETVADIFFVDKARVPSGVNTARGDMSDYEDDFIKIKENEPVIIDKYTAGEILGTDQFSVTDFIDSTAMGTRISYKDGIAIKATITSPYKFVGFYNDNGHKLIKIEVSDTSATNA